MLKCSIRPARPSGWAAALAAAALLVTPATSRAKEKLIEGGGATTSGFFQAGERGAVYRLAGGTKVRLRPGTLARFTSTTSLKLGPPAGPSTRTRILALRSGRADVWVPDDAAAVAVLINGPLEVSAVSASGHYAVVHEGDSTTVATFEGKLLYGTGDTWRPLRSGTVATVERAGPRSTRPVVAAPEVEIVDPLSLAARHEPQSVRLRWKPVDGAASYEVEIRSAAAGEPSTFRTVEPSASIGGLGPGTYVARVRALDAHGIDGAFSREATARIASYELPPGAYRFRDGTVRLGKRQTIRLVGAGGLLASYGKSGTFVPAPRAVGLARGRPVLLRLRRPGDVHEARLQLEPKSLRAFIAIGPPHATWPRDTLTLRVRLSDSQGLPIPDSFDPKVRVTVNSRPIAVRWRRTRNVMSCRLRPRSRGGPWVVRIEVEDPHGELLGRNFLEVAETPRHHRR